jgi:hypothetical protein
MGITQAARATAQRELSHLVEHGMLVALGRGKATHYELPMENWLSRSVLCRRPEFAPDLTV